MKRDLDAVVAQRSAAAVVATPAVLTCALAVGAILALHWQTAASIVAIWWRSETFAHGFVVIPICLWYVWRKRAALAAMPVEPWLPGLIIVAGAGALWFVASAADVSVAKQFALAFMLQATIVTIVGLSIARVLIFPLVFLLFAVPTGEFLVPTLIDRTADFTVAALRMTGVPVYRESNHFIIPSGSWSVVEACSGLRYIVASLMVGTLYAAIAYRSPLRRGLFLLASIVVPIVANWLRAYMIVMIGHLSGNRLAVGVDHIIYGWVFFGIVMLAMFWIGSFWQEDTQLPKNRVAPCDPAAKSVARAPRTLVVAAMAAIVIAGVWIPVDAISARNRELAVPTLAAMAGAGGWTPAPQQIAEWRPSYGGYAVELRQAYRQGEQDVGLHIVYYRNQRRGSELVTSGNMLTSPESVAWKQMTTGSDEVVWAGGPLKVDRATLQGSALSLETFSFYRVAGRETASAYVAKALLAWSRLTGRGDDSALVVFYAPVRGGSPEAARRSLRSFAQAMSGSIDRVLATAEESGR